MNRFLNFVELMLKNWKKRFENSCKLISKTKYTCSVLKGHSECVVFFLLVTLGFAFVLLSPVALGVRLDCLFEIFPVSWGEIKLLLTSFLGLLFAVGPDSKESSSSAGDLGLIPQLGRCPGEGNGYPLQYSFLDRDAWWATVHGVANSWTWLSN